MLGFYMYVSCCLFCYIHAVCHCGRVLSLPFSFDTGLLCECIMVCKGIRARLYINLLTGYINVPG